jgi:hypothetical protein
VTFSIVFQFKGNDEAQLRENAEPQSQIRRRNDPQIPSVPIDADSENLRNLRMILEIRKA